MVGLLSYSLHYKGSENNFCNFCYLKSEEGAEFIISTGLPDPLELHLRGISPSFQALNAIMTDPDVAKRAINLTMTTLGRGWRKRGCEGKLQQAETRSPLIPVTVWNTPKLALIQDSELFQFVLEWARFEGSLSLVFR